MAVQIQSFARVVPMIYAYTTPGVPYHEGWTKIGYTERQKVEDRIRQQTHTAGVKTNLEWQDNALYKDGSGDAFTDRDFHDWLEGEKRIERKAGREWFRIDGMLSLKYFNAFASRKTESSGTGSTYALRKEQQDAVDMTRAYFESGGEEFLWNAKPRFGKTLSSYDLVQRMGFEKVLIVSNRPSISNSWVEDFRKFVGWRGEYLFVSNTEALSGKQGVLSREEYLSRMLAPANTEWKKMIAFESLQGLKGSVYFGGEYDKLKWISEFEFDLLIVDEAQEGVETLRTERAFNNIRRKHTLFLSGTPFKQLAGDRFSSEQIFNWSYADEQDAKKHWPEDGETNPYETLPRLALFTYQLSNMIYDEIQKGLDLGGEDGEVDYAFDLNEFFATNDSGKFIHEAEIKKFLHALTTQEKYPFSTPELRQELSHTMWLLNRVASAKALAKLLADIPRTSHISRGSRSSAPGSPSCMESSCPSPLSRQHIQFHQALVDVFLHHAYVYKRFALVAMAENPLQAHHIARHFVIVIPERFAQRMAPYTLLDPRLFRDPVDDLIAPLPRDRPLRPRHCIPLPAQKDVFLRLPSAQKAVDLPSRLRVDEDPRLFPRLFRLDLRIFLPAQVGYLEPPEIAHAQTRIKAYQEYQFPAHFARSPPRVVCARDLVAPLQRLQVSYRLHNLHVFSPLFLCQTHSIKKTRRAETNLPAAAYHINLSETRKCLPPRRPKRS
jgi:hypothetical protein